jgi:hypothetical protein
MHRVKRSSSMNGQSGPREDYDMGNLAITFGNESMFPLHLRIALWIHHVNEKVCWNYPNMPHLRKKIVHRSMECDGTVHHRVRCYSLWHWNFANRRRRPGLPVCKRKLLIQGEVVCDLGSFTDLRVGGEYNPTTCEQLNMSTPERRWRRVSTRNPIPLARAGPACRGDASDWLCGRWSNQ